MIEIVDAYIQSKQLMEDGDHLIIGVSGGADSMALIDVLRQLAKKRSYQLVVVHINHGLRGETARNDEVLVSNYCKTHGLIFEVFHEDVKSFALKKGLSIEEAGRDIRYTRFNELADLAENSKIVVAHHENDQAETVLHNLMRGAALKGLGGIRPIRERICRPFLCVTKSDILAYCEKYQVTYHEDETNQGLDYTRNCIRHQLIPMIESQFNPQIIKQLSAMAEILQEEENYMVQETRSLLHRSIRDEKPNGVTLNLEPLLVAHPVLVSRLFRFVIDEQKGSLQNISKVHVKAMVELLTKETGKFIALPGGIIVEKSYDTIRIMKAKPLIEKAKWQYTTRIFSTKEKPENPKNEYTKWFDYDRIIGNLTVRPRRNGDFIRINAQMGRKKIKDIFIDEKIPKELRDNIPLLADEQEIIWIIGYRMSEKYKITEKTTKIIEVVINKEETNG